MDTHTCCKCECVCGDDVCLKADAPGNTWVGVDDAGVHTHTQQCVLQVLTDVCVFVVLCELHLCLSVVRIALKRLHQHKHGPQLQLR